MVSATLGLTDVSAHGFNQGFKNKSDPVTFNAHVPNSQGQSKPPKH